MRRGEDNFTFLELPSAQLHGLCILVLMKQPEISIEGLGGFFLVYCWVCFFQSSL